ncbi:MAG: porin [Deltaproteobacteria bacterium]|nr:porin [Deltaproteobacteria bacterium]MBI5810768.1 porin [Deltaproteobacteria bacterium]
MIRRLAFVWLFLAALLFSFWPPQALYAEENRLDRLEEEIKGLKGENDILRKRVDNVEADDEETKHSYASLSRLVDVSGYADVEFSLTDQPGESSKFRLRHLSLFFSKDIQKEWKLFTEIEFEDAPRILSDKNADTVASAQGLIFLEQMYMQYHPAFDWDIRLGRFLTPAGVWTIYHYPPYVPTHVSPLIYKVMFPEVTDGVVLRKTFSVSNSNLDTHFYAANGAGNPGSGDRNENKALGARVNYSFDLQGSLDTGASYYRDKDNAGALHSSLGAHMIFSRPPFKFQGEYALRRNNPEGASGFSDMGYYAQITCDIGKWTLAGRYDWYDPDDTVSGNSMRRFTGAVNYHFAPNVAGKLEFNRNEKEDPAEADYNELIFEIAVAIGDL